MRAQIRMGRMIEGCRRPASECSWQLEARASDTGEWRSGRTYRCSGCGARVHLSPPVRSKRSANPDFPIITFDDGEMFIVEAALNAYQEHARNELARNPSAPFSGTDEWAARIRKKLYLGMSANKPPVSNATTQVDRLPQFVFNVLFDLFESGILEEALRHYRAHCQKQQNSVQGRRRIYHEHSQEASAVDLRRAGRGIFMTMLSKRSDGSECSVMKANPMAA